MTETNDTRAGYAATRTALNQSHHAPGEIYTSPEIFRREAEIYFMREWLNNYPYKTELNIMVFLISGASMVLIAFLTVSVQTLKSAQSNPVDSLKYE